MAGHGQLWPADPGPVGADMTRHTRPWLAMDGYAGPWPAIWPQLALVGHSQP